MDVTSLPSDLQTLSDAMDAADLRAETLTAGLTDKAFFWRPDGGTRWSVALCLDHLATANTVYAQPIAEGILTACERGWARKNPARPGIFGRMFVQSLEPPVRLRTKAPKKIAPQPARTREEILLAYRQAHDRIRQILRDAAAVDINRATYPNPFLPLVRMRVSTGLQVIAAHDRRHLWQAEQVIAAFART